MTVENTNLEKKVLNIESFYGQTAYIYILQCNIYTDDINRSLIRFVNNIYKILSGEMQFHEDAT